MSAFEEAVQFVVNATGYAPDFLDHEEAAEKLRPFFDAQAHELAEKIRAEFADAFDANQEVLSGTDALLAADLIDPEVTE